MVSFEDLLRKLAEIQALTIPDKIEISDEDEVASQELIGGRRMRKTGNRVLVVKIPYNLTEEYILMQLLATMQRRQELQETVKGLAAQEEEMKRYLPSGSVPSTDEKA